MPSVNKKQATLMAMAAHNPAFAKKKGISRGVAREFNRADKRTGILRKGQGGSLRAGMEAQTNFGQGRGNSMFSKMPLMGHAMSGTQLGQADALIGQSAQRFADGGSVKKSSSAKPAKPQMSAKERKEVRALIERGKSEAVASLRAARSMLLEKAPAPAEDVDSSLAELRARLAKKSDSGNGLAKLYEQLETVTDPKEMMKLVDLLSQTDITE
jgi:hypothetical protein